MKKENKHILITIFIGLIVGGFGSIYENVWDIIGWGLTGLFAALFIYWFERFKEKTIKNKNSINCIQETSIKLHDYISMVNTYIYLIKLQPDSYKDIDTFHIKTNYIIVYNFEVLEFIYESIKNNQKLISEFDEFNESNRLLSFNKYDFKASLAPDRSANDFLNKEQKVSELELMKTRLCNILDFSIKCLNEIKEVPYINEDNLNKLKENQS